MSMFDSIKCEKELPVNDELKTLDVKWKEVNFQTKDLDNCLSNYRITKDGELVEDVVEKEDVYYSEQERKKLKGKVWCFVKDEKIIKEYSKKLLYHGTIRFYEIFDLSEEEDIWVEFDAYFLYGNLDRIELAKTEKQESRKIRMDKYIQESKKRKSSIEYKLKKYSGCFWILNRLSKICYNMSSFFNKIQTFCIRNMN